MGSGETEDFEGLGPFKVSGSRISDLGGLGPFVASGFGI